MEPAAVNPDVAAQQLGVSRTTTYRLIREGQLRSLKIGRRRLVPTSEISRFLSVGMDLN